MTFQELGLRQELLDAIGQLGFEQPTPVQEQAIPFMLQEERDLVALAQTGTGKTAAFGLPILNQIDADREQVQCLVLSPTRELCMQIAKDLRAYAANLPVRVVAVYGGEDIRVQLRQLDVTPQIIVATPGRLLDLCKRGKVDLGSVTHLVLDEADEMLDMGFKDDIEAVLVQLPEAHRTMLFSATMPPAIAQIARQYMHNAEEIVVGERNAGTENVDHIYYVCQARQRYLVLKRIVDMNPDIYGIVFCRTREETKDVAEKLMKDGYNADALHGDLSQAQRDTVMRKFREHTLQILVATDVAARGLDVTGLTHVINYNLPDDIEVYTHRSGRTGRIGRRGISVSILHSREKHKIRDIQRMLKREFTQEPIPTGMDVCRKQLFNLVSRMQNVEVDEDRIDAFMPEIFAMLEYLSREELIKHFVSLEFNRFLDYYRDAPDLNLEERTGKGEKRAAKDGAKRTGERVRLKINIGRQQNASPRTILGIINRITQDREIMIRDIEITPRFSFFSVYVDQKERLLNGFEGNGEFQVSEVKGRRAEAEGGKAADGGREAHRREGKYKKAEAAHDHHDRKPAGKDRKKRRYEDDNRFRQPLPEPDWRELMSPEEFRDRSQHFPKKSRRDRSSQPAWHKGRKK